MRIDESLNNQMEFDQLQARPTSYPTGNLPVTGIPPPRGPRPIEQQLYDQGHLSVWTKQLNYSLNHLIINTGVKERVLRCPSGSSVPYFFFLTLCLQLSRSHHLFSFMGVTLTFMSHGLIFMKSNFFSSFAI